MPVNPAVWNVDVLNPAVWVLPTENEVEISLDSGVLEWLGSFLYSLDGTVGPVEANVSLLRKMPILIQGTIDLNTDINLDSSIPVVLANGSIAEIDTDISIKQVSDMVFATTVAPTANIHIRNYVTIGDNGVRLDMEIGI